MTDSLDAFRWLASPEATTFLEAADQHQGSLTSLISRLRKRLTAEQAQLVSQQPDLRRRAAVKFTRADRMLFTPQLLEQATDEVLARCKAQRFPRGDSEHVFDLCCGCGGDSIGLSDGRPVTVVDRDRHAVLLAQFNTAVYGREAGGLVANVERLDEVGVAKWLHLDPDRRAEGRRTSAWENCVPAHDSWPRVGETVRGIGVKLAPATQVPDDWAAQAHREWFGSRGECRQQMLWLGELAHSAESRDTGPGRRSATVADEHGWDTFHAPAEAAGELPLAQRLDEYLLEPHAAVLAARLAPSLARARGWRAAALHGGYLTGPIPGSDRLTRSFAVLEALPMDARVVRRMLDARGIQQLEVKRRDIPETPDQILRRLRRQSGSEATLIVTRLAGGVVAALCKRL